MLGKVVDVGSDSKNGVYADASDVDEAATLGDAGDGGLVEPSVGSADGEAGSIWASLRTDLRTRFYLAAALLGAGIFAYSSVGKLAEIVAAEAVFFAGISLSLFVWGSTNVYNRSQGLRKTRQDLRTTIATINDSVVVSAMEDRVAGHIDRLDVDSPQRLDSALAAALLRWQERVLRQHDVLRNIAVLRRDLETAYIRGVEFFDAQVERERFHTDADQLIAILDDVNRAGGTALRIDAALRERRLIGSTANQGFVSMKLNQLGEIARDLTEALERRNHVYGLLFDRQEAREESDRSREFFRVMTSDLRKAQRTLMELLDRDRHNVRVDDMIHVDKLSEREAGSRLIRQQYRIIHAYVTFAEKRVEQVKTELEKEGGKEGRKVPPALEILAEDVRNARQLLADNWRPLMKEIGYDTKGRYHPNGVDNWQVGEDQAARPKRDVPALPRSANGR